ncbi:MAG: thioredoxin family protein [Acidobacteriota bacterium]|nr:thioredoxin family protein [Acidobacteriota bacterium]
MLILNNSMPFGNMAAFAFLGGLILNLMPCVFPVLSLKALGLMNGHRDRREFRRHGLAYGLGVLVCFWILLGLLLLLRRAGQQVGWGFQLQSPSFIAVLAALLFLMGLSLAGLFEIGMSWMGLGSSLASRSGYSGSFFTGVLATVVATPCTAPFMGTAIGFALAQSIIVAFAAFTALAIGLALPYVLLSWFPQWAHFLPKPGPWMETFKQAMAFPMFAAVIWLIWVFGKQVGVDAVARLLIGLLIIGIGAWLLGRVRHTTIAAALAILLFALGLWIPLSSARGDDGVRAANSGATSTSTASGEIQWEAFSPERVEQYRSQGRPVFVDFTAAWCLACQVNERAVFGSSDVRRILRSKDVVLLKADWTSQDPVITKTLASFGRTGVPFYLLYGKNPNDPPAQLPEVLTPGIFLDALNRL